MTYLTLKKSIFKHSKLALKIRKNLPILMAKIVLLMNYRGVSILGTNTMPICHSIKISMEAAPIPDQPKLQAFVDNIIETSVYESICNYIRIPNITHMAYATEEEWERDDETGGYNLIEKAGSHIAHWVNTIGIKGAVVSFVRYENKSKTPAIIIEIEGSGVGDNKQDTYFFYGHYDKQPPMEGVSGWSIGGPYNPTPILDQTTRKVVKLYGRGGADDGYSTYATMVAIKALQDQEIPLPRIVMIAEGDEETGNGDVEYWINHFLPRFGTPKLVFCLDSGTLDYDRFWLTNSLRGYVSFDFTVQVLTEAVHSGSGTGVIPTCFRIIRQLIDRIELASTGQMPKLDLPSGVPAKRLQEIEDLVKQLGSAAIAKYPTVPGLQTPLPDIKETIILNTWRAQLEVLTFDGYPPITQTSNIINPKITVRVSIRLPPTLNHLDSRKIIDQQLFKTLTPYNCVLSHTYNGSDNGFDAPENPEDLIKVFEQSSQAVFGNSYLSMGQGGSIPFMNFLREKWPETKFVVTGLLGPESNAHGPNECLRVDYLKKLTACFSQIIARSIPVFFPQKQAKIELNHPQEQQKVRKQSAKYHL